MRNRKNRKYVVNVNRNWLNSICNEKGIVYEEKQKMLKDIHRIVEAFLSNKGEWSVLFSEYWVAPDGRRYKAIEIENLKGRHSGKLLKKLRTKRKTKR